MSNASETQQDSIERLAEAAAAAFTAARKEKGENVWYQFNAGILDGQRGLLAVNGKAFGNWVQVGLVTVGDGKPVRYSTTMMGGTIKKAAASVRSAVSGAAATAYRTAND